MAEMKSETQGALRVLTFDRPEVRNALSQTLRAELRAALLAARDDEGVRAVVLTGSGKAFCAGLDLAELKQIRERSACPGIGNSAMICKRRRKASSRFWRRFVAKIAMPL